MRSWRGPKLPRNLLHTMYRITREEGHYDPDRGGQFTGGKIVEVPFKGVVMPMNNEDLQYMDSGTSTINVQKVYTNGETLEIGAQFRDGYDDQVYTVKQELTHGPIHSMKRYMVEKKGGSKPK